MCLVADSSAADSSLFGFVMKEGMTNELSTFHTPVLSPSTPLAQQVELHSSNCQPGAGTSMSQLAFVRAPPTLLLTFQVIEVLLRAVIVVSFATQVTGYSPPTTGPAAGGGGGAGTMGGGRGSLGGGRGRRGRRIFSGSSSLNYSPPHIELQRGDQAPPDFLLVDP
jgi:hypothetical protein